MKELRQTLTTNYRLLLAILGMVNEGNILSKVLENVRVFQVDLLFLFRLTLTALIYFSQLNMAINQTGHSFIIMLELFHHLVSA